MWIEKKKTHLDLCPIKILSPDIHGFAVQKDMDLLCNIHPQSLIKLINFD